ncbi:MAG TPA: hypothetical protein VFE62_08110 [Gemmataceae bacterium]|nr:hypothetical protein [Gemmataceae bacterium]
MGNRRYRRIAIFALAPAALVVAWLLLPTHQVTEARFERISKGMTENDVEEILGGPGDTINEWMGQRDVTQIHEDGLTGLKAWRGGACTILVEYDRGRVRQAVFAEVPLQERSRAWYRGKDLVQILAKGPDPESPIRFRMKE